VQHDQAHPVQHARMNARHDLIADLAVRDVAPPDQHIGLGQRRLGQAVLRLVQRRRARAEAGLVERGCDRSVDTLWINLGDSLVMPLMTIFVPNGDA
jgi:hypothetical protein